MKSSLAVAYNMKRRAKKMADGGPVGPTLGSVIGYPGSNPTAPKRMAEGGEVEADDEDMVSRVMKKRMGTVSPAPEEAESLEEHEDDEDMVASIMRKRKSGA